MVIGKAYSLETSCGFFCKFIVMIEPPEGHEQMPHKVAKHYYMMLAEMTGNYFLHDEYCIMAYWMLTNIALANTDHDYLTAALPD